MRALRFALRSFGREIRSGEVLVLLAAVALAVAAVAARPRSGARSPGAVVMARAVSR